MVDSSSTAATATAPVLGSGSPGAGAQSAGSAEAGSAAAAAAPADGGAAAAETAATAAAASAAASAAPPVKAVIQWTAAKVAATLGLFIFAGLAGEQRNCLHFMHACPAPFASACCCRTRAAAAVGDAADWQAKPGSETKHG